MHAERAYMSKSRGTSRSYLLLVFSLQRLKDKVGPWSTTYLVLRFRHRGASLGLSSKLRRSHHGIPITSRSLSGDEVIATLTHGIGTGLHGSVDFQSSGRMLITLSIWFCLFVPVGSWESRYLRTCEKRFPLYRHDRRSLVLTWQLLPQEASTAYSTDCSLQFNLQFTIYRLPSWMWLWGCVYLTHLALTPLLLATLMNIYLGIWYEYLEYWNLNKQASSLISQPFISFSFSFSLVECW